MPINPLSPTRADLLRELQQRVDDRVLEPTNAALLRKLIERADTDDEAIAVAALGTTYKRTGFHFDVRLERLTNDIRYLRRNPALSFTTSPNALTHRLIIGDNYEALQNLLIPYRGKVDVIYIDPPYGKDKMGEFAHTNYENALTRDNLLSMLYPRLQLAKQLLSGKGILLCSIDDRNHAYVKGMMDDIFREFGFVTSFVWQKKKGGGQNKFVYEGHEYILCYLKNKSIIKKLLVTDSSEISEKNIVEKNGHFYRVNDDFIRVVYGKYESGTERRCHYEDILEIKGKEKWDEVQDKLKKGDFILRPSKSDATKHYVCRLEDITEGKKKVVYSIISGIRTEDGTNEVNSIGLDFDSPKPSELLKILLNLTQNKQALILDFFAGSGTTGHAVLELNRKDGGQRKFILCQLNEKTDTTPNGIAYDVTTKRLKRTMTGTCYDGTADFPWIKTNEPYGDNLEVTEIDRVFNAEATAGKTPFDMIDETLYGQQPFTTMREKIEWVCQHFQHAQKAVENDSDWEKRKRDLDHATRS
ncbi:MAG: site-specific DNA-methyltransferase [Bacteroidaceae bacterium]|nr:site-specific DNA-methyltransferase [Bacteroidaceae bacterium]